MHLDPHAAVLYLGRVATQIALTDVIEAFATVDFKAGRMQGALHHPILHKALRQQGISMGAHVFQGMDLILVQKQTDFLSQHLHACGEIRVQSRTCGHVVPLPVVGRLAV